MDAPYTAGQGALENERSIFALLSSICKDRLPIRKIIDTVHFTRKSGAPFLQIADACALIIRYYFEQNEKAHEFIAALTENTPDRLQIGSGMRDGWAYITFPRIACLHAITRAIYTTQWIIATQTKRLLDKTTK